ncbi:MAG: Uma2 family endonuclease [Roseiflexaceae bacterium]|nr:Uma2 family endonuclease [Roseiflexaceae bacterium]
MQSVILQSDRSGTPVRMEYVRGRFKVEASPASRHQKASKRIEGAIRPSPAADTGCGCYSLADVLIRFHGPDEALKRPDIAVFCVEPPDSDEALDMLPAAVIEILSLGYEEKDLGQDGAAFYRSCGVADVIVFDPRTGVVRHYHAADVEVLQSPTTIELACGCRATV